MYVFRFTMSYSSKKVAYIILCFGGVFWAKWVSFLELIWGSPEAQCESYDEVVRIQDDAIEECKTQHFVLCVSCYSYSSASIPKWNQIFQTKLKFSDKLWWLTCQVAPSHGSAAGTLPTSGMLQGYLQTLQRTSEWRQAWERCCHHARQSGHQSQQDSLWFILGKSPWSLSMVSEQVLVCKSFVVITFVSLQQLVECLEGAQQVLNTFLLNSVMKRNRIALRNQSNNG